jgi:hypothetical protein
MRQAIRTASPLPEDNVVVHLAIGESRTPRLSRPLMAFGLLAGVLMGILALKAGALFVSPVSPHGKSAQSPAASSQTAARNAVVAETQGLVERQVPPMAAAPQAKSITKGVEASVDANEATQAQALVRERQRANTLARDLAAARREIEARTAQATWAAPATGAAEAAEANAAQLRQALQGERERLAALAHELAAANREIETRGVLVTAADRETAEIRRAGEAAALYLQQALEEERKRVASLARELAVVRQEIEARAAMATAATETGEAAALQQRQALEEEHRRATSLTRELVAARQESEKQAAVATKAAEASQAAAAQQRQMLEEERERVASLTRELAAARREIEMRIALATGTAETDDATALPPRQGPEDERQRANAPGEFAAASRVIDAATGSAKLPDTRTTHIDTTAAPTHPTSVDTGIADHSVLGDTQVAEAQKLLTRAAMFLSQGDISAARIVLERALDKGSAEAGYRLAETYDPVMLSSWRTLGTRGDPAKARELYARAYADGIEQAKDRMNALQ